MKTIKETQQKQTNMQTRNLQLRRALSATLFVLLLVAVGMKNALAQHQVATLQHNDTITGVFYGSNALVSAHNAAVAGDVITLSSGTFSKCDIGKSITIRGAGCVYDTVTLVTPTIIAGDFAINTNNISFEGVNITGTISANGRSNVSFIKCDIFGIGLYYSTISNNWQFVNCIIKMFDDDYVSWNHYGMTAMSLINSVVRFTNYTHNDIYNPNIVHNSIVLFDTGKNINNIEAYNSIIVTGSDHTISNCIFYNCIGIETGETSLFEGQTVNNVMTVDEYSDVFETFNGTISYENCYQLKEEIATTFLGQDGTEVGIYGGVMPYKTRPAYMILKNCNVAGQTDENQKLNVEMELIGPED